MSRNHRAILFSGRNVYIATLNGSGRVVLTAGGSRCDGPAIAAVKVDHRATVHKTMRSRPGKFAIGAKLGTGHHRVVVRLANDRYRPPRCDRNLEISKITLHRKATPAAEPGAATTGVPAGYPKKIHRGNLVITKNGTTLDGWDIHGYVEVKANNVTIKRSIVRGGKQVTRNKALIMAWWGKKNLVVKNSTLVASKWSLRVDGVSGSNFTASHLDIHGVVDAVKIIGPNVTVKKSWLHGNIHSQHDPYQPDGRTHDDSIQLEGGSNISIRGNRMDNAHNAAIQVTQNYSRTSRVRIEKNWMRDGVCTINVTQAGGGGHGHPISAVTLSSNRMGDGSEANRCPMRLPRSSSIRVVDNVWQGTHTVVRPVYF